MPESNNENNSKYITADAPAALKSLLSGRGYRLIFVKPAESVTTPISAHPDIQLCRLGCRDYDRVIQATSDELRDMSGIYPEDVRFNAACTGKYFIHNLSFTHPRLLEEAAKSGMLMVDVKQGYSKCSIVIVDEDSIITYDRGIACKCLEAGLSVLLIRPGYIRLKGYNTGFIGGASGRIGNEIIFNGSLDEHPDGKSIRDFVESKGLICTDCDWPLEDIGSII